MTHPKGGATTPHSRSRLVRRLRTLRNLEWFNVPFLILLLSTTWSDRSLPSTWQRLIAYLLVAALLVVGGWYWHVKLRQVRDGRPIERHLGRLATFERLALATLAVGSLALTASWVWAVGTLADRTWATGFIVFAWAEYVNYFRVQLMHDTMRDLRRLFRTWRLRRSALAADLAAWRGRGRRSR